MRRFKLIVPFFIAALAVAQLGAQTPSDLVGTWKVVKVDIMREVYNADLVRAAEALEPVLATAVLELGADGQCRFVSPDSDTQYSVENGRWYFEEKRRFIHISRPDIQNWGTLVLRVLDGATPEQTTLQILESALKLNVKRS